MSKIQPLIEVWGKRPNRVEPDNESDLVYIFGALLPALRDAIPEIQLLQAATPKVQGVALRDESPSTGPLPAPETERSSRNQEVSPNTDGIAKAFDQTAGSVGTPASSAAKPIAPRVSTTFVRRTESIEAIAPPAVLPAAPQETEGIGNV